MTPEQFLKTIQQEIREEGYMSATKLVSLITARSKEFEADVDVMKILDQICCKDIHTVEYTNWLTHGYRRKDLYYYLPEN